MPLLAVDESSLKFASPLRGGFPRVNDEAAN
jgi:hypothetical protein